MHLFSAKPPSHPGCCVTRSRAGLVAKWQWRDTLPRRVAPGWRDTLPRRVAPGWRDTLPRRVAPGDGIPSRGVLSLVTGYPPAACRPWVPVRGFGPPGSVRVRFRQQWCSAFRVPCSPLCTWGLGLPLITEMLVLFKWRKGILIFGSLCQTLPSRLLEMKNWIDFFLLLSPEMLVFFRQLWRFLKCFTLWSLWKC